MASNGIREKILLEVKSIIEGISSIKHVQRKIISSVEELMEIPFTQFPYVCMTGGLPIPKDQGGPRLYAASQTSKVRSNLKIEIRTYGHNYTSPDTEISTLADDIWKGLYSDPTIAGLVEFISVKPVPTVYYFDPFFRFDMILDVEYIHGTDGI